MTVRSLEYGLKTYLVTFTSFGIRSHHFMANRWGNSGNSVRLYFWGLQNHCSPHLQWFWLNFSCVKYDWSLVWVSDTPDFIKYATILLLFKKNWNIVDLCASQVLLVVKNPPANAGDIRDGGLSPGSGRRAWWPTPIFLPEESNGQRNLAGYSPWGSQRVYQWWYAADYNDKEGDVPGFSEGSTWSETSTSNITVSIWNKRITWLCLISFSLLCSNCLETMERDVVISPQLCSSV